MGSSRLRSIGLEMAAWTMIGSGVVRLLTPRQQAQRWAVGPARRPANWAAQRPMLMRATGVIRIGAGVWLARQLAVQRS